MRLEEPTGPGATVARRRLRFLRAVRTVRLRAAASWALLVVLGMSTFAPLIIPEEPTPYHLDARLTPPMTWGEERFALLGTDELGRDVASRVVFGLRTTLWIAIAGVLSSALIGVGLGSVAYAGRNLAGALILAIIDAQLAIPTILIALAAVSVLGSSPVLLVSVIAIADYAKYARLVHAELRRVGASGFVEALRASGATRARVFLRHLLPGVAPSVLIFASSHVGQAIVLESSLSFLGVGVQPPAVSLGYLLSGARPYLLPAPWLSIVPAAIIVYLTLSTVVAGEWLRGTLDPYASQGRE